MATDIDPCRETKKLENETFATNLNDNTVKRVEDEASVDAKKLVALEQNALSILNNSLVDFVSDNVCRRSEAGSIFFDYYLNEELQETFKITIMANYDWCLEMVGSISQEDGFYLLQEDDSQILRE